MRKVILVSILALAVLLGLASGAFASYGTLGVTYAATDEWYWDAEHFGVHYGEAMAIGYQVSGNTVGVSKVEVKVINQESSWTDLGSSSSGSYSFTPSYWTTFLPRFLVTYEDNETRLFHADAVIAAGATDEEVAEFVGGAMSPACLVSPWYCETTKECRHMGCSQGECVSRTIVVCSEEACPPYGCYTDDDC